MKKAIGRIGMSYNFTFSEDTNPFFRKQLNRSGVINLISKCSVSEEGMGFGEGLHVSI